MTDISRFNPERHKRVPASRSPPKQTHPGRDGCSQLKVRRVLCDTRSRNDFVRTLTQSSGQIKKLGL